MFLFSLVVFSSCEKEIIEFDVTSKVIYVGDSFTINVTHNDTSYHFVSSNIYAADVSKNGLVTANHVGATLITKGVAKCNVEVAPKYNTYKEPIMAWGTSYSNVKSLMNNWGYISLSESQGESLAYTFNSTLTPVYAYTFKPNNYLYISGLTFATSHVDDLTAFLRERYKPFTYSEKNYYVAFIDGIDESHAKNIIIVKVYSAYWFVIAYSSIDVLTKGESLDDYIKSLPLPTSDVPDNYSLLKPLMK